MQPSSHSAFDRLAVHAVASRAQTFSKRLDQLIGDPQAAENVHQIRVAGRRLRVAVRGFAECFPAKNVNRWNKDIRRFMRALSPVRDADVQLAFIDDFITQHIPAAPVSPAGRGGRGGARRAWPAAAGLKRLHLRLTQQRDRQASHIERAIARFHASATYRSLPKSAGAKPDLDDPILREHSAKAITPRLESLLTFSPYVFKPGCVDELHRMRIAAKRLRYTLELYEPVLKGKQKKLLTRITNLQSLLGDLHDCDTWLAHLDDFLVAERQRMIEYQGHQRGLHRLVIGIEYLQADRRAARSLCLQALQGYWRRLENDGSLTPPAPQSVDEPAPAAPSANPPA